MPDLLCGTAAASSETFRFVSTGGPAVQAEPVEVRSAPSDDAPLDLWALEIKLTHRKWNVTDPSAREKAGRELLGLDYEGHCAKYSAQWFIEPGRNAAALLVFRSE